MTLDPRIQAIDKKLVQLNRIHRRMMYREDFSTIERKINAETNKLLDEREKLLNHIT